jgi:hypothetical protein
VDDDPDTTASASGPGTGAHMTAQQLKFLGPLPDGYRVAPVALLAVPLFIAALFIGKGAGAVTFSTGALCIIAIRLIVPLLILRWWLVGGVVAMLVDAVDVILIELIGLGGFGEHYAELDKALDTYYLILELYVALQWQNPWARIPTVLLFIYRAIGVALFETIDARVILFIFPNMFENWWLYCVVVMKWFPRAVPKDWKSLTIPMLLLLVPKMAQEYLLHYAEAEPWNWTKEHILGR